ncbi:Eco57I restriction-modification methylase domain-containing protein [Nitrospirillum amazonense]|uniref:Eco57I restriction-modification methylase domain-containing protein n=1 Tax=Nitrospirillum amazonense TaxID=28077 RepID=UPI002412E30C|nr:Eco57I restriction-modification methylase domain-containing protein [Nitrospirillum amazonense]MDG3444654.1 Eco57I restriction-modification methylase domain-containing protein [Nitrospirillum amazonense]
MVTDLLDRLNWPACGGRLLDPGAGDGAFIAAAVARIDIPPNDVEGLCQRVEAWEIHPSAVEAARRRIALHLAQRGWSTSSAVTASARVVIHGDFLADPLPDARFTVIAGNPPYLRFANLPPHFKAAYSHLPRYARGDLLHAFMDRASRLVDAAGKVGLITSDRWLFNSQAAPLRLQLGDRLSIVHVRRLDSATTFYRPKVRRQGTPPRVHPIQIVMAANEGSEVRALDPNSMFRPPSETRLTLGQVATIHCAPYLGPDGIFCLTRAAAEAAGVLDGNLVPVADIPRDADVLGPPSLFAIRTARGHPPSAAVIDHLRATRHLMPARGLKAQGSCEWAPPEPWVHRLPLSRPALVMPRIVNRVRVLPLPAGHLPRNHNLVLDIRPEHQAKVLRHLRSAAAWQHLYETAPRLENGYVQVSASILRAMPLEPE